MQCPVDGETLQLAERAGVEIDYCPKCRGVWLDRGELDKIIDRSEPEPPQARVWNAEDDRRGHGGRKKKKRGGFLEEIFDF